MELLKWRVFLIWRLKEETRKLSPPPLLQISHDKDFKDVFQGLIALFYSGIHVLIFCNLFNQTCILPNKFFCNAQSCCELHEQNNMVGMEKEQINKDIILNINQLPYLLGEKQASELYQKTILKTLALSSNPIPWRWKLSVNIQKPQKSPKLLLLWFIIAFINIPFSLSQIIGANWN